MHFRIFFTLSGDNQNYICLFSGFLTALFHGELSLLELFFVDTKVVLLSFVIDFSVAVSSSDAVA